VLLIGVAPHRKALFLTVRCFYHRWNIKRSARRRAIRGCRRRRLFPDTAEERTRTRWEGRDDAGKGGVLWSVVCGISARVRARAADQGMRCPPRLLRIKNHHLLQGTRTDWFTMLHSLCREICCHRAQGRCCLLFCCKECLLLQAKRGLGKTNRNFAQLTKNICSLEGSGGGS